MAQNTRQIVMNISKQALEKVLTNLAQKAYKDSEDNLPIQDVNTKSDVQRTRFYNATGTGINYGFDHPVMDSIENGRLAEKITGTYKQNVSSHKRRTKTRNVRVRKHIRTYKNQKPVLMPDGNWAIVDTIPAVQGTNFLEITANKWFSESNIAEELKLNLER